MNQKQRQEKQARTQEKSFDHLEFSRTMMTVKQVMECFSISRTTVYNWEKLKILLPVRIGRRVYFTLSSENLDKFGNLLQN